MAYNYNISITVTGRDLASQPLGRVNSILGRMGEIAGGVLLAGGIQKIGSFIFGMGQQAIGAAVNLQMLNVSLETLAAREIARTENLDDMTQAMGRAGPMAQKLLNDLKQLGLESPYEFPIVSETFRLQLAFGQTADMAIPMTKALLDTASALGLTNDMTHRLAYNLGQIGMVGKITGVDLRQLRMVGLDLADVLQSEMGMSIEQFNKGLETGKVTMDDFFKAFTRYADKNFGGAAVKMSKTLFGIKSSFKDLFYFAGADLLSPSLESVNELLIEIFDTAKEALDTGYFAKLGEQLADKVGGAIQRISYYVSIFQRSGLRGLGRTLIANFFPEILRGPALRFWIGLADRFVQIREAIQALRTSGLDAFLDKLNLPQGVRDGIDSVRKGFANLKLFWDENGKAITDDLGRIVTTLLGLGKEETTAGVKGLGGLFEEGTKYIKDHGPEIAAAVDGLANGVERLAKWTGSEEGQQTLKWLATFGVTLWSMKRVIEIIAAVRTGIATLGIISGISAGPIGWLALAIAALVATIVTLGPKAKKALDELAVIIAVKIKELFGSDTFLAFAEFMNKLGLLDDATLNTIRTLNETSTEDFVNKLLNAGETAEETGKKAETATGQLRGLNDLLNDLNGKNVVTNLTVKINQQGGIPGVPTLQLPGFVGPPAPRNPANPNPENNVPEASLDAAYFVPGLNPIGLSGQGNSGGTPVVIQQSNVITDRTAAAFALAWADDARRAAIAGGLGA